MSKDVKRNSFYVAIIIAIWAIWLLILLSPSAKGQSYHVHKMHDLRMYLVEIVEIKNGQLIFADLEEQTTNNTVDVDKLFRFLEVNENNGTIKVLGLGALKGSKGILTVCSGCNKAIGMRLGKNLVIARGE